MPDGQHGISAQVKVPQEAERREEPWRFDWFGTLRWLEAYNPSTPRFGTAVRPGDEIVRISQKPSLSFAPATLTAFGGDKHGRAWIEQMAFGLYGPNGPMPHHFTEHVHERSEYDGDHVLREFLDIFHHRFSMLFYRAWAGVQATNSLDRPGDDCFSRYVNSLTGYGETVFAERDTIPDRAKRYMSGHLVRLTRNPEGLAAILRNFFGCPFRVEEWRPHRLHLEKKDCTALGSETTANKLGRGAVCGISVIDRQHRFRIHVGPLSLEEYQDFLPIGRRFMQLRDWVRNYVGFEFSWDVRLVLRHEEVPRQQMGLGSGRLGWTAWMGRPVAFKHRGDLVLEGERPTPARNKN
jgi:type VI secretion system protein ImpH